MNLVLHYCCCKVFLKHLGFSPLFLWTLFFSLSISQGPSSFIKKFVVQPSWNRILPLRKFLYPHPEGMHGETEWWDYWLWWLFDDDFDWLWLMIFDWEMEETGMMTFMLLFDIFMDLWAWSEGQVKNIKTNFSPNPLEYLGKLPKDSKVYSLMLSSKFLNNFSVFQYCCVLEKLNLFNYIKQALLDIEDIFYRISEFILF